MGNTSPDIPIPAPTSLPKEIQPIVAHPERVDAPFSPETIAGNITIDQSKLPPTDPSPPQEKTQETQYGSAEFLPEIRSLLASCGMDPATINPVPIGEGANHIVFLGKNKDGEAFVIKIPKRSSPTTMNVGYKDEQEQIAKIRKAFPNFSLPTEVHVDEKTGQYIVVQKAVEGKPITNHTTDPSLLKQLEQIVELNNQLYNTSGESLDFVGMPGFVSWVKRQFKRIILRKSDFEVSNLLVDKTTNRIQIIDTDILRIHNVPLKTALISRIGFFVNRMLMKWYFGLDIKKNNVSSGSTLNPQPQPIA